LRPSLQETNGGRHRGWEERSVAPYPSLIIALGEEAYSELARGLHSSALTIEESAQIVVVLLEPGMVGLGDCPALEGRSIELVALAAEQESAASSEAAQAARIAPFVEPAWAFEGVRGAASQSREVGELLFERVRLDFVSKVQSALKEIQLKVGHIWPDQALRLSIVVSTSSPMATGLLWPVLAAVSFAQKGSFPRLLIPRILLLLPETPLAAELAVLHVVIWEAEFLSRRPELLAEWLPAQAGEARMLLMRPRFLLCWAGILKARQVVDLISSFADISVEEKVQLAFAQWTGKDSESVRGATAIKGRHSASWSWRAERILENWSMPFPFPRAARSRPAAGAGASAAMSTGAKAGNWVRGLKPFSEDPDRREAELKDYFLTWRKRVGLAAPELLSELQTWLQQMMHSAHWGNDGPGNIWQVHQILCLIADPRNYGAEKVQSDGTWRVVKGVFAIAQRLWTGGRPRYWQPWWSNGPWLRFREVNRKFLEEFLERGGTRRDLKEVENEDPTRDQLRRIAVNSSVRSIQPPEMPSDWGYLWASNRARYLNILLSFMEFEDEADVDSPRDWSLSPLMFWNWQERIGGLEQKRALSDGGHLALRVLCFKLLALQLRDFWASVEEDGDRTRGSAAVPGSPIPPQGSPSERPEDGGEEAGGVRRSELGVDSAPVRPRATSASTGEPAYIFAAPNTSSPSALRERELTRLVLEHLEQGRQGLIKGLNLENQELLISVGTKAAAFVELPLATSEEISIFRDARAIFDKLKELRWLALAVSWHRDFDFIKLLGKACRPIFCGNLGCEGDISTAPSEQLNCQHCERPIVSRCGNKDCNFAFAPGAPIVPTCPGCGQINQRSFWICKYHGKIEVSVPRAEMVCGKCLSEVKKERLSEGPGKRTIRHVSLRPDCILKERRMEVCPYCVKKAIELPFEISEGLEYLIENFATLDFSAKELLSFVLVNGTSCPKCGTRLRKEKSSRNPRPKPPRRPKRKR